jgi:hypothetical protein
MDWAIIAAIYLLSGLAIIYLIVVASDKDK